MVFRRRQPPAIERVAAFWAWWATNAARLDATLAFGNHQTVVAEVIMRVRELHPRLELEIGSGVEARRSLVVSSGGDPETRSLTHRWLSGAPTPSAAWEYHGSKPADPSALHGDLEVAGRTVRLSELRFGVHADEEVRALDVVGVHPAFGAIGTDSARVVVTQSLRWLLGEDAVSRWVRTVGVSSSPRPELFEASALAATVSDRVVTWSEPSWAIAQAHDRRGRRAVATVQHPFGIQDWALCDLHGAVTWRYPETTSDGLPTAAALERCRRIEEQLEAVLGDEATIPVSLKLAGVLTVHLYCDPESTVRADVDRWSRSVPGVSVKWTNDPCRLAIADFYPR